MSADRLTRAVRSTAIKHADTAGRVVQLGTVVDTAPIRIELLEGRHTLDDDELTLTQDVLSYDGGDGIEVGDSVVLVKKETGGDIHWVVTDILSDNDPVPKTTEADVDAKLPWVPDPPTVTGSRITTTGTTCPALNSLIEVLTAAGIIVDDTTG